jgi:hypothetical protein
MRKQFEVKSWMPHLLTLLHKSSKKNIKEAKLIADEAEEIK